MPPDADFRRGRPSLYEMVREPPRRKVFRMFVPGVDSTWRERRGGLLTFSALAVMALVSVLVPPNGIPRSFAAVALAASVTNMAAIAFVPPATVGQAPAAVAAAGRRPRDRATVMDLTPTAGEEALRQELRGWLTAHLPWEYGAGLPPRFDTLDEEVGFGRRWQAGLASARWVGVTWPERYGGRGLGPAANFVVQEELARARAPELVGRIGVNLAGPTLLACGTDEQKRRWLPNILDASQLWCQLFSEPDAGSDLTSVRTRAVARRDGLWVLDGQKVWTSYAQFADWGICLARSDPETPGRDGLSFFVVDMHATGVEVRPLVQVTGEAEFNEVFLHEVAVERNCLVGAVGGGWRVAGATLSHERGVNPRQLVIHLQHLEELLKLAVGQGAFEDERMRRRLAQAYVEVRLFQQLNWRSLSRLNKGEEPGPEGSILKLYWSEMSKRLHALALDIVGEAAPLWRGAEGNPGDGTWQRSWLYYLASSIFAGTNEIQRNLVGERVLGLPRERAAPAGASRRDKEEARAER